MSILKSLLLKSLLLGFSLLFCFGAAEMILRAFMPRLAGEPPFSSVEMYEKSAGKLYHGLMHAPRANVPLHQRKLASHLFNVTTNSLGLIQRNDYKGENPVIYILGDSFTAGVGVDIDKNYFSELQEGWPKNCFLNLSVSGYGTYESRFRLEGIDQALKKEGKKRTGKDMAILHFFLGNDFYDNAVYQTGNNPDNLILNTKIFLKEKFYFYRLARNSLFSWRQGKRGPYDVVAGSEFPMAKAVLSKYIDSINFKETDKALEGLISYCSKEGISLMVVIIPTREMASNDLRRKYSDLYGENAQFDYLRNWLRSYLEGRGIFFIDLTEFCLSSGMGEKFYFNDDDHWSNFGQKETARYVLRSLEQHLAK